MGPIKTSTGPYCWAVIQVWSKSNSLLNFKKCYRYSLATVKNHAPTLLSHLVINWNPSHKARLCFRFGNQRERERERMAKGWGVQGVLICNPAKIEFASTSRIAIYFSRNSPGTLFNSPTPLPLYVHYVLYFLKG